MEEERGRGGEREGEGDKKPGGRNERREVWIYMMRGWIWGGGESGGGRGRGEEGRQKESKQKNYITISSLLHSHAIIHESARKFTTFLFRNIN